MHFSESSQITSVCAALSNPNRLALLRAVIDENGQTHPELYRSIASDCGLGNRETAHTYLRELTEADLIQKTTQENGRVEYYPVSTTVELLLDAPTTG